MKTFFLFLKFDGIQPCFVNGIIGSWLVLLLYDVR